MTYSFMTSSMRCATRKNKIVVSEAFIALHSEVKYPCKLRFKFLLKVRYTPKLIRICRVWDICKNCREWDYKHSPKHTVTIFAELRQIIHSKHTLYAWSMTMRVFALAFNLYDVATYNLLEQCCFHSPCLVFSDKVQDFPLDLTSSELITQSSQTYRANILLTSKLYKHITQRTLS